MPPTLSPAVEAGRARRVAGAEKKLARVEWFINEVVSKVDMTLQQRVRLATELVKNQVIRNISVPVVKMKGPISKRIQVSGRSKAGEFPRADTTQLMKTIFSEVTSGPGYAQGFVGTPLDYGVILELRMNRSFLVRTLMEESDKVKRILTGPMGTGFGLEVR